MCTLSSAAGRLLDTLPGAFRLSQLGARNGTEKDCHNPISAVGHPVIWDRQALKPPTGAGLLHLMWCLCKLRPAAMSTNVLAAAAAVAVAEHGWLVYAFRHRHVLKLQA